MLNINYKQALLLGTLPVVLISAPFAISDYKVDLLTNLLINTILVSSFHIITTTGGWSLAHVPMMGCGAYATALLSGKLGVPFWVSLPGYVDFGRIDDAYRVVNMARDSGSDNSWWMFWRPEVAPFRQDPRFAKLVTEMGLLDYWRENGWPDTCQPVGDSVICE